ncbi:MAG: flagellar filament capping protein FliD [Candidatus Zixiibacteriota bacterium]
MAALTSIDGLSSGLNTTEIIDSIIQVERRPAALMEAEQTEKTNIVSAWKAFQAKLLALVTEANQLTKRSSFEAYSLNVSDDTVLTATSTGRVSTGSYDVQVLSVARNHQIASQGISDQSLALLGTGTITIQIGTGSARTITVDSTNNSLEGIRKAINDAKVGVTASIVNDGSSSDPYRLVLSGDKTGQTNAITFSASLTGGTGLNFSTSTFDSPESLIRNSSSTAQITLGGTASYTGSSNKIYTFTVAGTGAQTVGTNNITLNWSDGINSGSILVTQADTEVALVGTGADGLKISLGSGVLYGGDKFQVGTFSPLLQQAADARIALGSTGGDGSPITVSSKTNEFKDVIGGVTLNVRKVSDPGTAVTIQADVDTSGLKDKVNQFIKRYNDIIDYINEQNKYNSDSKESGVLFGDYSLQSMQISLRAVIGSRVAGLTGNYNQLAAMGIRSGTDGKLSIRDQSKFDSALTSNLDDVIKLFTSSGSSTNTGIEFVSSTDKTKVGEDYVVDITRVATRGGFRGGSMASPASTPLTLTSSNNRLKLTVDGLTSAEIVLAEKTYATTSELVQELQDRISADSTIGSRGVVVTWVDAGVGTGYLDFRSSSYGASSRVNTVAISNSATSALGLDTGISQTGTDVAGTINGEEAEGIGQLLTGKTGNTSTEGLKLKVTLTSQQMLSGEDGSITLAKGVASKMYDLTSSLTRSGDGLIDRRIRGYENQIADLKERVEDFDKRLASRRERLLAQFIAMEEALAQFSTEGQYLTGQLNALSANWSFNNNSTSSNNS